jgi:hypothetical protein
MAKEDLLAQLLIQLTEKEGPPPLDDNSLIQKMVAPNDSAKISDNGVNLSLLNPVNFVWGGIVNGQTVNPGWKWGQGQWK